MREIDGVQDIMIGAYGANSNTGQVYIIYGGSNLQNIDLSLPLPSSKGYVINGINPGDNLGYSVVMEVM